MMYLYIYITFTLSALSFYGIKLLYNNLITYPRFDHETFTMEDVLAIVSTVLEIQFATYQNNIFSGEERILNTASFENYYKDLTKHVIGALSPSFFKKASLYIKEDALIEIICSMIREYLQKKV